LFLHFQLHLQLLLPRLQLLLLLPPRSCHCLIEANRCSRWPQYWRHGPFAATALHLLV
jgi:hypothetical protein